MMAENLSEEQDCSPGSNASCVVEQFRLLSFWATFALYLLFAFIMLVTILGNFVVIVSVCHFKQMHNPTNVFILSLALADLLVGVIVIPAQAITTVHSCWFFSYDFCLLHYIVCIFVPTLSIFHLICIAIDRHQAICNPLHYSRKITMSVAIIMVCVSWTLAALYTYGGLNCFGFCNSGFHFIMTILWILDSIICFFFPCTVMVCLYTQIFIVAKEHLRKIEDMNGCSNDRQRGGLTEQSDNKAAKTLSIVLGAYILCWMPYYSYTVVDTFNGFTAPLVMWEALFWLGCFNSALNPIIYAFFYPCFKKCLHCIITLKIFSSNSSNMSLSQK